MSISWKVENRSISILAIESHSAGTSKSYTLLYITRGALEDVVCQCFFSKLQLANGNGKRVAELLVSCRCVLSAVGLSMASLKRDSVEMSYVQRSHVVTPHKLAFDTREINLPCEESILLSWKETEPVCPSLYRQITCVAGWSCADLKLPYAGDFELIMHASRKAEQIEKQYLLLFCCWQVLK